MKITLVLGTRPQIIKSAPIIKEAIEDHEVNLEIIHTGQHYDYEMSRIFFDEMNLPDPTVNLEIGSGSHAWQTGKMLIRIEEVLSEISPDLVLVPGDTNSTLAGALVASKMDIELAHIEAGARSYDKRMPEEINRKLTDHCSDVLFTVSENCSNKLIKEGIPKGKIHQVGDTMYDVLLKHLPQIKENNILDRLDVPDEDYVVITTHRQENIDNKSNILGIVRAILELDNTKIIFPIHPRTEKKLIQLDYLNKLRDADHVMLTQPVGYHEMLNLIMNSRLLLTDSGGMQKEAYWLKTKCITLRNTTEWVETINVGANILVGADTNVIIREVNKALKDEKNKQIYKKKFYGDGKAAKKIVQILKNHQKTN